MFLISKIYNFVTDPAAIVFMLLVVGSILLWTRWRRGGRRVVAGAVMFIVLITVFPVGGYFISVLENRFPMVRELPRPVTGIITLGGMINQFITIQRGQAALGSGAERMTEFIALARRHPEAKLVFTGGSASLTRKHTTEADAARIFFRDMGLDPARIVFENRSRNTYENAEFTYDLLSPRAGERWVLITSASHMPRSIGAFRKAGWNPIPYPVDFTTELPFRFNVGLRMTVGLGKLSAALHEWMGLVIYRILGRSDEIFPGPQSVGRLTARQKDGG